MFGSNTKFDDKNQFLLNFDPRFTDIKSEGHPFILSKKHPVETEWDKIVFSDAKGNIISLMI